MPHHALQQGWARRALTAGSLRQPTAGSHAHDVLLLPLACVQQFVKQDLDKVYFSNFLKLDIKGIPCFLTRTG